MSNYLWTHGLYNPWNSPGQDTGVGCYSLLQGIFPTQGQTQDSCIIGVVLIVEPPGKPSNVIVFLLKIENWLSRFNLIQHSHAAAAKSPQSCPTLCDPLDGSPPGSPVPGILQARILEWVAISFSNAWKWKVKVKSLSRVWLCDPMDCSLPGSSVHGIFQARALEWGAIAFSEHSHEKTNIYLNAFLVNTREENISYIASRFKQLRVRWICKKDKVNTVRVQWASQEEIPCGWGSGEKKKSPETGFEGLLEFQQMDIEKNDFMVVMEGIFE